MLKVDKPIEVSAGILGRTRTLLLRTSKGSSSQRSITISSFGFKRSRHSGSNNSSDPPATVQLEKLQQEQGQEPEPEQNQKQELQQEEQQEQKQGEEQLETKQQDEQQQQQQQQQLAQMSPPKPPSMGILSRLSRINTDASNTTISPRAKSIAANAVAEPLGTDRDSGESNVMRGGLHRTAGGLSRRLCKSVSITSVKESRTLDEIDRSACYNPMSHVTSEHFTTRSIMKMRRDSNEQPANNFHNAEVAKVNKDAGPTVHQLREQKIFQECRFIPISTFYKKVLVAPNDDRQFFASPKCSRVPGSSLHYDIDNQNPRHHRDVNYDLLRDSLKRACTSFRRTSQFRQGY